MVHWTAGRFPVVRIAAALQWNTDDGSAFGPDPSELWAERVHEVQAELED